MYQPLFVRQLTDDERRRLGFEKASVNKEEARRAEVILLSADGKATTEIAERLGYHPSNVKKWIRKFNLEGIEGLAVKKRGPHEGPRPSFSRDQVDRLLALSRTDPAALGLGFRKWTAQKLATAAVERGIVERISHVTVQQILKRNSTGLLVNPRQQGPSLEKAEARPGQPDVERIESRGVLADAKKALEEASFERAAELFQAALSEGGHSPDSEAEIRIGFSQALEELSRFEESYSVLEKYEDPREFSVLSPRSKGWVKLRMGWPHSWLRDEPKAIG
ncbi:MAG TPA: helix-turn-helix domain-containing protein, partial [Blastocatellia bacterium]|nr:helix-turn-helix domain-containing protein [Blastocatellia bacterium]